MIHDREHRISDEDMKAVAKAAAEAGYSGTDASPVVSLAEYLFLARENEGGDGFSLLLHVRYPYFGSPSFKIVEIDRDEIDTFAREDVDPKLFGFDSRAAYREDTGDRHRIQDYLSEGDGQLLFPPCGGQRGLLQPADVVAQMKGK